VDKSWVEEMYPFPFDRLPKPTVVDTKFEVFSGFDSPTAVTVDVKLEDTIYGSDTTVDTSEAVDTYKYGRLARLGNVGIYTVEFDTITLDTVEKS
jgi:hypothetical protein